MPLLHQWTQIQRLIACPCEFFDWQDCSQFRTFLTTLTDSNGLLQTSYIIVNSKNLTLLFCIKKFKFCQVSQFQSYQIICLPVANFLQTDVYWNSFYVVSLSCSLYNSLCIRYLIAIHFSCVFLNKEQWTYSSLERSKYNNLWTFDAYPYMRWYTVQTESILVFIKQISPVQKKFISFGYSWFESIFSPFFE